MATPTDPPARDPASLTQVITGFQVEHLLSNSEQGAIYQATQISLDRTVTIKVLPQSAGEREDIEVAFTQEAKTMARLNHPNLVDVFDFGKAGGLLYIIMEQLPDKSLHDVAHGCHVDEKEAIRLVADLCLGLQHAHDAGIIHRSLNPGNVLIDSEARAKIVDFGMAELFEPSADSIYLPYKAPELRLPNSQASSHDPRVDIYSVGIILYTLITGHLPESPYCAPSEIRGSRKQLDDIVARAIQPSAANRYATAKDMANDLEALLEKMGTPPTQELIKSMLVTDSPTAAAVRRTPYPAPAPKNNTALVATFIVVALILGGVIFAISDPPSKNEEYKTAKAKPAVSAVKPAPKNPVVPATAKPKQPRQQKPDPKPANPIVRQPPAKPDPPKPAPTVVKNPTPKVPEPKKPEPPKPPAFDTEEWLENARAFMRKKAKSTLRNHDEDLLKNIDRFERAVRRVTRKLDRSVRRPVEIKAKKTFEKFRLAGRIPEKPPKDSPDTIKKLMKEALTDQEKISRDYETDFTKLRITYIKGLDAQITKLKKEGNQAAAEILETEIENTQNDMPRFIRILRDLDPDPKPEPNEKDKK